MGDRNEMGIESCTKEHTTFAEVLRSTAYSAHFMFDLIAPAQMHAFGLLQAAHTHTHTLFHAANKSNIFISWLVRFMAGLRFGSWNP